MKLYEYLDGRGEHPSIFAARIGVSFNTIKKIVNGQRQPSLPLAVKISAATGGKVKPEDMLLKGAGE